MHIFNLQGKPLNNLCEYTEICHFIAQSFVNEKSDQRQYLLHMRRSNMTVSEHLKHERAETALSHTWVHVRLGARVWSDSGMQGKQGKRSMLCQASPERGGLLGGEPFVGDVAGGHSLSFATSSPTCANTHKDTHGEEQRGFSYAVS